MRRSFGYLPSMVLVVWAVIAAGFGNVAEPVWLLLMAFAVIVQVNELRRRYHDD